MKHALKKKFEVPHPFVIMLAVLVLVTLATHLIPAGVFERVAGADGRMLVEPDSFRFVAETPAGVSELLLSIPRAFSESVDMIYFMFFVGAGIAVINQIGIIPAMVEFLARKYQEKGIFLIPVVMFVIALSDATLGITELCLLYVPMLMPLVLRLGFDRMTTVGMVLVASVSGLAASLFNPFIVAISQRIAELPLFSGTWLRVIAFVVFTAIGTLYVMRYAKKVYSAPAMGDNEVSAAMTTGKLSIRQKLSALFAAAVLVYMICGLLFMGWDMPQMSVCFLVIGVVCGLIAGMKTQELCSAIIAGCSDMTYSVLLIVLARAVSVVMSGSNILDTIVWYLSGLLRDIPAFFAVIGAFFVVALLTFLIPSVSGKAIVVLPILTPLADVLGFTRQTAVLSYQFGASFIGYFWPTNGIMMGCVGAADVSYSKWLRFYTPLLLIYTALACLFLIFAQVVQYGPF